LTPSRAVGTGFPVVLTVWVENAVAVEAERDHYPSGCPGRRDEYCAAQRLCFGEPESSNDPASRFGEPPLDHRRIVKRQRSGCRPRVRPLHARIRHTDAAAHRSAAALTGHMPAAPTQTYRHQQGKHQPPHTL